MTRNRSATTLDPDAFARLIWEQRYRYTPHGRPGERRLEDTFGRVAEALAAPEHEARRAPCRQEFMDILGDRSFLPGGRILAGAGTAREVTLFNCFVMGTLHGSLDGMLDALRESALTLGQGGGIGLDLSPVRPLRADQDNAREFGGPVEVLRLWDGMCEAALSASTRRGAMMGTLRCDHPDIEAFIDAKRDPGRLTRFNLSVLVSDAFLDAVRRDEPLVLRYPAGGPAYDEVPARQLWEKLLRSAYHHAEPGVLFIDRINAWNNLGYRETISATNPCGEIPLPPYGACDLGSINLTRLVQAPFLAKARLDYPRLKRTVTSAVRLLDNVIDVSRYPLHQQAATARGNRRIGLGITGLGDTLAMLGLHYDSKPARDFARQTMRTICVTAYEASVSLAREKGAFPFFDRARYLESPFIRQLPERLQARIADYGIRNSHVTAVAPTGTISLLAGNVSSGIEPIYALEQTRRVLRSAREEPSQLRVRDWAYSLWRQQAGEADQLPDSLVTAHQLSPEAHLRMQAAVQQWVDSAVSKTINIPAELPFERFRAVYEQAHALGLKGCTVFRPNPVTGNILGTAAEPVPNVCCRPGH